MRHRNKTKKLGRTKSHRKATLSNLAGNIIEHQQIRTTLAKAKAARSVIEKLITVGKKGSVAGRRQAFKLLQNHYLVKKLFDEIAPTFSDRNGGYSRIIKLGRRQGDGAELAILQLVGFEPVVVEEKKPSSKKKAAPKKEAAVKEKVVKEPVTEEVAEQVTEAVEEKAVKKAKPKKAVKGKAEKGEKTTAPAKAPKEKKSKEVKAAPKSEKKAKSKKEDGEKEKAKKKKSE